MRVSVETEISPNRVMRRIAALWLPSTERWAALKLMDVRSRFGRRASAVRDGSVLATMKAVQVQVCSILWCQLFCQWSPGL
jgi:hypothetical protein